MDSIIAFTGFPLEVIVVDDSSTDDSAAKVEVMQTNDGRIRLLRHEKNMGTYAARETGIRAACGEYIFCVDPDDTINSECFELAKPYIENIDIISFNAQFIFKDSVCLFGNDFDESLAGKEIVESYVTCRLQNWGVYPKLIRTEIAVQALDELNVSCRLTVSEDFLLFFVICFLSGTYQRINFTAYNYSYFEDDDSATRQRFTLKSLLYMLEQNEYVVDKLTDFFTAHGYTPQFMFPVKRTLAEFILSKIHNMPELTESDEKKVVGKLAAVCGIQAVYGCTDEREKKYVGEYARNYYRINSGKNTAPAISVIIPVYNTEKYLRRCMDSVVNQTFRNIEIICVNDGTRDKSVAILEEYAVKDERVTILHKKNGGLSSARNEGMKHAHAEYINFVDSDDWIEGDTLLFAYNAIQETGADLSVYYAKIDIEDDAYSDNPDYINGVTDYFSIKHTGLRNVDDNLLLNMPVTAWNKLFKREIIEKYSIVFPNGRLFEDNVFFFEYASVCKNIFFIDKQFYHYIQRNNSIMTKNVNKDFRKMTDRLSNVHDIYLFMDKHSIKDAWQPLINEKFIACLWEDYFHANPVNRIRVLKKARKIAQEIAASTIEDFNTIRENLLHKKYTRIPFLDIWRSYCFGILTVIICKTQDNKVLGLTDFFGLPCKFDLTFLKPLAGFLRKWKRRFKKYNPIALLRQFNRMNDRIIELEGQLNAVHQIASSNREGLNRVTEELSDTRGKLEETNKWVEGNQGWLERVQAQADEQHKWLDGAHDRITQVHGWLEDTRGKLEETNKWVEGNQGWLERVQAQADEQHKWLDGAHDRITQVHGWLEDSDKKLKHKTLLLNYLVDDHIDETARNIQKTEAVIKDSVYKPFKFNDIVANEMKELGKFLFCPNNGNLGDVIIAEAEYQFFSHLKLDYSVMDLYNNKEIIDEQLQHSVYVYGGGGLFHELYNYQNVLNIFKQKKFKKIIVLPSSFYKCDDVLRVFDERFIVFCREERSYNYCISENKKARFILSHDMAFNLDYSLVLRDQGIIGNNIDIFNRKYSGKLYESYCYYKITSDKIINTINDSVTFSGKNLKLGCMLRLDKESALSKKEIKTAAENPTGVFCGRQKNLKIIDLSAFAWISCTDMGLVKVLSHLFIQAINYFDIIITDRLHIGIVSALLGKQVYLLDNSYGKLSGVYKQSMNNFNTIRMISDISEIDTLDIQNKNQKPNVAFNLEMSFQRFLEIYYSAYNPDGIVTKTFLGEVIYDQD